MFLVLAAQAAPLVAVVVVDRAARDEGYALALEDVLVDDALPIEVGAGELVQIVDPDGGRHDLDVAAGEAWEVSGARGEAFMSRIGEDIRSDVVRIDGDRAAVRAIAAELGAEVLEAGGQTWLVRSDLLFDVPWVESDRIDEIALVRADAVLPTRPTRATRPGRPAPPPSTRAVPPVVDAVVATPVAPAPSAAPAAAAPVTSVPPVAPGAPPVRQRQGLDPEPYLGLYLCGNTTLYLAGGGAFAGAGRVGTWDVSAPGVVHLFADGGAVARAAIEVDRHFCRAIWEG
jgi:hypothetical protein